MPGPLLHLGAQVLCMHGGQATPVVSQPSILLSGQPATTLPGPYLVAGCALPPPPAANGPCVTGQFMTAAVRVLINGQPALLLDSIGLCAPSGTPLLPTTAQTRVVGA